MIEISILSLRRNLLHVDSLALVPSSGTLHERTLHERTLHVDSLALTVAVAANAELSRLHVIHHSYPVRRPQYDLTVLQPVGEGNKPPHGRPHVSSCLGTVVAARNINATSHTESGS